MSARDFLVEIGTEELPPKSLFSMAEAFAQEIGRRLDARARISIIVSRSTYSCYIRSAGHYAFSPASSTFCTSHIRRRHTETVSCTGSQLLTLSFITIVVSTFPSTDRTIYTCLACFKCRRAKIMRVEFR